MKTFFFIAAIIALDAIVPASCRNGRPNPALLDEDGNPYYEEVDTLTNDSIIITEEEN